MNKKARRLNAAAISNSCCTVCWGKESFQPLNIGWTGNFEFAFAHKDQLCSPFKRHVHDPAAPYDASDDIEERQNPDF